MISTIHFLLSIMITTTSSPCLSWFDFRSVPWYDLLYFFTTSVSVWIYTGCFFNCSLPKNFKYQTVRNISHLELFMMRFYCVIQQKELFRGNSLIPTVYVICLLGKVRTNQRFLPMSCDRTWKPSWLTIIPHWQGQISLCEFCYVCNIVLYQD